MAFETSRIALVTGGSRGIGRAVVEALARRGDTVWFCGRSAETLRSTEAELARTLPGRVRGRVCDVRDFAAVERLLAEIVDADGRLDLLVNNAGLGLFAPVDELEPERFREVLETNLFGVFHGIRAAAPAMKRRGAGWIVNIASLAAKNPFAGGAAYNASKFGLLGLSEAAMLDLRHHGVRVAAILPGSVATELRTGFRAEPQDWMLSPEDVARAVTDLLDFPDRALPSLIELRPSRPPRK
jgi:NAD(P)-dependent dehydrogenase (short-subunit alcohol dehydrogenase family)